MIKEPITTDSLGRKFAGLMRYAHRAVHGKNDDYLLIIAGPTGSGKSTLGLWLYELLFKNPTINQIALTREDFAKGLAAAGQLPKNERYLQYDEGKLNRREWQSKWSKELMEIYHDIRGLNIFHVWCTAYPELLDRVFVEERVKGLVYIGSKVDGPRRFLFFTKKNLLNFLEQNERLSSKNLKKWGAHHASIASYFRKYDGVLSDDYQDKKLDRMQERVTEFYQKWGRELMGCSELRREWGVSDQTVRNWLAKHQDSLVMGEELVINEMTGRRYLTKAGVEKVKMLQTSK